MMLYEEKHAVGTIVVTPFIYGVIKEVVWGPDKGWGHEQYYYLVENFRFKPHWVLESEVTESRRA